MTSTQSLTAAGLCGIVFALTSCEVTETIGVVQEGAIVVQLIHKSSYPNDAGDSCSAPVGGYNDNNPAIPGNAPSGLYGPANPGVYEGHFTWGGSTFSLSYQLEAPADGYSRTYTLPLVSYVPATNRCLLGWMTGFSYRDDRM